VSKAHDIGDAEVKQTIDAQRPEPFCRPRPRRLRLSSAIDCRRELAMIYREARYGGLDAARACRLAFLLNSIIATLQAVEFEDRLRSLERKADANARTA
jgi:hypothetical protein